MSDQNRKSKTFQSGEKLRSTLSSTTAFYDTPLFHIILCRFAKVVEPIWKAILTIRWAFARPMNLRVLPRFIPGCIKIPYLKRIPNLTIGEILFSLPMLMFLYWSYHESFNNADVVKSGVILSYPIYLTYLSANKSNSLFSFVLGIPFERMIRWHTLWAMVTILMSLFHLVAAYKQSEDDHDHTSNDEITTTKIIRSDNKINPPSEYRLYGATPNFCRFLFADQVNSSGTLMILIMSAMILPGLIPVFRRVMFELFYYPHVILAFAIIIFCLIHGMMEVIFLLLWWLIDLGTRYLLMAGYLYPRKASIRRLPTDIIELRFTKPENFTYKSGQFIQLAIPTISLCQFHPFTISSSPHQDDVTVHIRMIGTWTKKLGKLAEEVDSVNIMIEGPYGSLSINLDDSEKYKMVLLISGGIGVTPMQSIFNSLIHEQRNGREFKKLHFVWAVREYGLIQAVTGSKNQISGKRLGEKSYGPNLFDTEFGDLETDEKACQIPSFDDVPNDDFVSKSNNVVTVDYYLTNGDYAPGDSPAERHGSNLRLGRPNIMELIKNTRRIANEMNETRVAVCVCGPKAMVDICREECRRNSDSWLSSDGVSFDLHEEIFEL